ncbi:MAG: hypothetical protein HFJ45_02530 [Clostridia bacterium]|nr:hypothetical protein [Clostridia bacterium]
MKNITVLDKISNLIEKTNYKTAYIEIQTDKEKYTLELEKRNPIGFRSKLDEH